MLVSIIVPIYNVEKYLDKCVNSIISQSHTNIEIILIDDGSTDNSGDICDKWQQRDNRIRVVHQDNAGLSVARNMGLKMSNGKYVMFVDGDDYIEINAIEIMLSMCEADELDIVKARYIVHYDNAQVVSVYKNFDESKVMTGIDYLVEAYSERTYSAGVCTGMYRRELIIQNNLFFKKNIYHEDDLWTPQILLNAKRVKNIDFPFYHYIMRDGSITHLSDKQKHGTDLINTAYELSKIADIPKYAKTVWNDLVVGIYYFGIRRGNWKIYKKQGLLSKRFALKHGLTKKNIIRTLLFVLSYHLYVFVDSKYRVK